MEARKRRKDMGTHDVCKPSRLLGHIRDQSASLGHTALQAQDARMALLPVSHICRADATSRYVQGKVKTTHRHALCTLDVGRFHQCEMSFETAASLWASISTVLYSSSSEPWARHQPSPSLICGPNHTPGPRVHPMDRAPARLTPALPARLYAVLYHARHWPSGL